MMALHQSVTSSQEPTSRRCAVSEVEVVHSCPRCGSEDAPKLIVRGSETAGRGLSLRCRDCSREWSDERSSLRAS